MSTYTERIIGSGAPDRALDEDAPPSIQINAHSEYAKELRKWEQHPSYLTPPGTRIGNPYVYRPYPKMLYKAAKGVNGQPACVLPVPEPSHYEKPELHARALLAQETWNRQHQKIVESEEAERLAIGQGWAVGPQEALDLYEKEQQAIAEASAQAHFQAKRMSEQAQREWKDAGASTDVHVTDLEPKKKRGRPAKDTPTPV